MASHVGRLEWRRPVTSAGIVSDGRVGGLWLAFWTTRVTEEASVGARTFCVGVWGHYIESLA